MQHTCPQAHLRDEVLHPIFKPLRMLILLYGNGKVTPPAAIKHSNRTPTGKTDEDGQGRAGGRKRLGGGGGG